MQTVAEVAVALRYDPAEGGVPQVTAKGRDAVAAQILAALEVGRPIPAAAFAAVAGILAYLYRTDKALAEGRAGDAP